MKEIINYIEYINNSPIIFLCGPYYSENNVTDRREILRKYINNLSDSTINSKELLGLDIKPLPLIVDNIFTELEDKVVNLSLIEEIIASASTKTYIFLDTISTALELGLFSTSYTKNKITVLLPKDFKTHSPHIGEFTTHTLESSKNIEKIGYDNKRVYYKNEASCETVLYSNFKTNKLPISIRKEIKSNIKNIDYIVKISFSKNIIDSSQITVMDFNNTVFYLPLNVILILTNDIYKSNKYKYNNLSIDDFKSEIYSKLENKVISLYLSNAYNCDYDGNILDNFYLHNKGRDTVLLKSYLEYDIEDIIYNVLLFLESIRNYWKKNSYLTFTRINIAKQPQISMSFLFQISNNDLRLIRDFENHKLKYITSKYLIINGKSRKIIMYKNNSNALSLRNLHKNIADKLGKLIQLNDTSFAYKKNKSIKLCCEKHLNSNFSEIRYKRLFWKYKQTKIKSNYKMSSFYK